MVLDRIEKWRYGGRIEEPEIVPDMISRRAVLWAGTAISFCSLPLGALSQASFSRSVFLLLDLRDDGLTPAVVQPVVDAFLNAGLAVSLILPAPDRDNPVYAYATGVAGEAGGLVDLVAGFRPPASTRRYDLIRAAVDLRRDSIASSPAALQQLVAVWLQEGVETVDSNAMRAMGFRAVYQLPATRAGSAVAESMIESPDWGQIALSGGSVFDLGQSADSALAAISRREGDQIVMLRLGPQASAAQADGWVTALQTAFWEGNLFTTRASDYLLQVNPGASKLVSLIVDSSDGAGTGDFLKALDTLEFPYTHLLAKPGSPCIAQDTGPDAQKRTCLLGTSQMASTGGDMAQIVFRPVGDHAGWMGPDEHGRFILDFDDASPARFLDEIEADPLSDVLLRITAADVDTELKRQTVLNQLVQAKRDGLAHFRGLNDYIDALFAPDAIHQRYWWARESKITPSPLTLDASGIAGLRADAEWAWRYIDQTSDRQTAIAAATRQAGNSGSIDRNVTFWDIGSQVFGIAAAATLDIISRTDAEDRLARIMANLPTVTIDGLRLPPAIFNGDTRQVQLAGYDTCDVGRFLMSLRHVVSEGLVTQTAADSLLAGWDLPQTIRDGRPFGFVDGAWQDLSASHCTGYARQGYGSWGMTIDEVLPALDPSADADAHMAVLYAADNIGHYGAEPYLLQALEGEMTPAAAYLTEALLDAQQRWFIETGTYKCVSEAPLSFAPWFSFQGLRPNRAGEDGWVISTPSRDAAHSDPDFLSRAALLSAKSAYLWAAVYGGDYAGTLVTLMQERARAEPGGFSVGLYESDLAPMFGYSDVNTNGIILSAVARMLREA